MTKWWPKRYLRKQEDRRPSWDEYFAEICRSVSRRSTCHRRQVGAVVVKDKRILSTGYNGAPSGLPHCLDSGCLRDELGIPSGQNHEICRGNHAEANAVASAALHGISLRGSTIYSTHQPCVLCSKLLINAGIVRVIYIEGYPDEFSRETLGAAGIDLIKFVGSSAHEDENHRPAAAE